MEDGRNARRPRKAKTGAAAATNGNNEPKKELSKEEKMRLALEKKR